MRVKRAQRGRITWGRVDLDAEVPADHEARAIAAVVDKLDLCASATPAPEPAARSPVHLHSSAPRSSWAFRVYATSDSVGSGREVARLVEFHAAYRWLCGGVAVA